MFFLPTARFIIGTSGMKMNDGAEPSPMKMESCSGAAWRLQFMKYAPAALPIDIIANAVTKKKAMTLNGRLWKNSIQRSLILTLALSSALMTTFSLHCVKQKMRSASPTRAYIVIVVNHATGSLGRPSTLSSVKYAMSSGNPEPTASPPQLAMNIRTEVRMVISSVSRVSDELRAP